MTIRPKLTFEIKSSRDMLKKLLEEYSDFDKQHLNPRFAINCAITSWHLTDWTYHEFFKNDERFQDRETLDKKGCRKIIHGNHLYQQYSSKQCPELEYMRLITNGIKHCILYDINRNEKTVIQSGSYSTDYNRNQYNVPKFIIEINSNKRIDFEEVLIKTIKYWERLISEQERYRQ